MLGATFRAKFAGVAATAAAAPGNHIHDGNNSRDSAFLKFVCLLLLLAARGWSFSSTMNQGSCLLSYILSMYWKRCYSALTPTMGTGLHAVFYM